MRPVLGAEVPGAGEQPREAPASRGRSRPPAPGTQHPAPAVPRFRRLRLALKLSAGSLFALALLAAWLVALYTHRGDVRAARRAVVQQLPFALESGEQVERRAFVSQRNPWDYFRETHGILVATDRRILFVGVPPEEILSVEWEPQAFVQGMIPDDTLTLVRRSRVFFGTARGVVFRALGQRFAYGTDERDWPALDSLVRLVEQRQIAARAAAEQDRLARLAAEEAARQPIYHTVERGEALELIARKYNITPDSVIKLNNLPDARIKAGQVLLVKPRT